MMNEYTKIMEFGYNGKIYNNHKRVSYPRWLLKQQGIEVPDDCVVWHKDGDYTNNKEENLQLLCPNCHSLTETYGILNKGNSKRRNRHLRD